MSLLGCLVITEGYIVAYLATNLQKESYTIQIMRSATLSSVDRNKTDYWLYPIQSETIRSA